MQNQSILIAGPCAAESREQILTAARELAAVGVSLFRAGVWKPRTSPASFQGAGDEALSWLAEAKRLTGLPVATEVATPEHVDKALEAGVDVLWIGARTAANPIAVQEIADAIRKTCVSRKSGVEVLVKNPVNEDASLWLGNIERLEKAGAKVAAIHRGCNHKPCWAMAFELRRQRPDVTLILDPSHLSGDAEKIPMLCQQAMDLNYDGLMVEVHPHPEEALSDAKQQITPHRLQEIVSQLVLRKNSQIDAELLALRKQIDETDDAIWSLIAHRMEVVEKIGDYKRAHGLPVLQSNRFSELMERRVQWATQNGLDADIVRYILNALHEESCRHQL